jgi:4-hydroxy-tetrahydrodipicolinate synthase
MTNLQLSGAFTALVTPFASTGAVDFDTFDRLLERQLEGGIGGLVPCGTTGESPTLEDDEQSDVIAHTVKAAKGHVPVVAGTGSNCTNYAKQLAKTAEAAGADAVMVLMPYYNKPCQEGLFRHVQIVAQAVSIPVVLYNIPGRTAVDLSVETTLRILDACPNVVGIKDASGGVNYCQDLLRRSGDRVTLLSGDDVLTLPMMVVGAKGVISVTSNLYPREVQACAEAALAGDWKTARARHLALYPVHRSLFVEPSPQPIKGIMAARGLLGPTLRPPMVECRPETVEGVQLACEAYEARR